MPGEPRQRRDGDRAKPKVSPPFADVIDRADELVMIYCGRRAWELARPEEGRVASLVYPRNRDPADFRWPVKNKNVLVLVGDQPTQVVDLLTIELLRANARAVHVYGADGLVTYDPAQREAS